MRFIKIPASIMGDFVAPDIVDITEPLTVSISGTAFTIDSESKISGESTVTYDQQGVYSPKSGTHKKLSTSGKPFTFLS